MYNYDDDYNNINTVMGMRVCRVCTLNSYSNDNLKINDTNKDKKNYRKIIV